MLEVASALNDSVDAFGVAFLDEALQLRNVGISIPILVLDGFYEQAELRVMQAENIWAVVHSQEQIDLLSEAELLSPFHVWLKMNTGMQRLGFEPDEYKDAYDTLCKIDGVNVSTHMTHFACADEEDRRFTQHQIDAFLSVTSTMPGAKSLANSAGVLNHKDTHADWIRPGIALYGLNPCAALDNDANDFAFRPAMRFHSQVLAVREVKRGTGAGYNHRWTATRDSRLAVVAVGYGDGYPRDIGNGAPILVNGERAKIVGCVSMDMLMADVTDISNVSVGSPVELWGTQLPVKDVARHANLSMYELVTRLTGRVSRLY